MDNQLPKITYLFGAGASANVLPTVKDLPKRIDAVKKYIDEKYIYNDEETVTIKDFTFKKNDAKEYLLKGLENLFNFSHNHSTVDTYAKKLDLRSNSREINELCFFLALYFNIEQKINGVDLRYETFFISILDYNAYKFPDNLKFLSWNYDLQMELSHSNITGANHQDLNFELFNITRHDLKKDKFCSIKINGSCNFINDYRSLFPMVPKIFQSECSMDDLDFALSYCYSHLIGNKRYYNARPNMNFAWFRDGELLTKIVETYDETEILVVIGYSFPFFNREIDRQIIRSMKKLKKIYIQDLMPENIKSRFLSILPDWEINGIKIISVNDITEFFLPPEL